MDDAGSPQGIRRAHETHAGLAAARAVAVFLLVVLSVAQSVALAGTARAAGTAVPPAPTRWVTDDAGFLSEATRAELDARLRSFEDSSGHQVLLWIGRTTGAAPIEDWATRAFASWRVGRKGLDDGVVLFIMRDDRKIRIEVGYGLEERLPDVQAAAIIREAIAPRLRDGDRDGAARAGVGAILGALGGTHPAGDGIPNERAVRRPSWGEVAVVVLLAILLLGFLITHPRLAILFLTTLASGRGQGRRGGGFGGMGGGGGFSGGGGRSGGGGATGSW